MSLRYVSTRGEAPELGFADVLLTGLATDGGLYVPDAWPTLNPAGNPAGPEPTARASGSASPVPTSSNRPAAAPGSPSTLPNDPAAPDSPSTLPNDPAAVGRSASAAEGRASPATASGPAAPDYVATAVEVMWPFVAGEIDRQVFEALTAAAYADFEHPDVAPLVPLDDAGGGLWLMELFGGPTLAFKDIALQLLGRLFDHELARRGERVTIVGATSGDTGSAAIEACRDRDALDIFVLHPHGRVSEVQRRQMTTVTAANVHNIAVEGSFDDCQDLVKAMFADETFRRRHRLAAVNSINFARVMAQIVYYVVAARALAGTPPAGAAVDPTGGVSGAGAVPGPVPGDGRTSLAPGGSPVAFGVPSGNFGNVYAGYAAHRMGLKISQLVVGSNRNDILARFLATHRLETREVIPTMSPSMDIQVSSNLERLLFELHGRDGAATAALLAGLRTAGGVALAPDAAAGLAPLWSGAAVSEEQTLAVIADVHRRTGRLIDPHTAVGVGAATACRRDPDVPMVVLATAHPAKFPDAVARACGRRPELPERLADLHSRPERCTQLPNDLPAVQRFVAAHTRVAPAG